MSRIWVICSLVAFLIALLVWRIYIELSTYCVIAKFNEMRPLPHHIQVLYKGLKIGNVVSAKHSDDFEYLLVTLRLPKNIKLPANVVAYLMIEKRRFHDYDYIEIVKPLEMTDEILKEDSQIKGIAMVDSRNFFANQNKEDLEAIRDNLYKASENLNTTIEGLGALFGILQEMIEENRASFKQTSQNLSKTTQNLSSATKKINNSILEEELKNTLINLESLSDEMYSSSQTLNQELPSITKSSQKILKNVDDITTGVASSMKQPFGGIRLLLGKTINKCY